VRDDVRDVVVETIGSQDGVPACNRYDPGARFRQPSGSSTATQRWMPARRGITEPDEISYCLACSPLDGTIADLVRVAYSRWKIEECLQAAKVSGGDRLTRSSRRRLVQPHALRRTPRLV
jgi:SRSO17 transposase